MYIKSKCRALHILKYLWWNTDEENYATTADILDYLNSIGISCNRKTIPGDIAKLCEIGIDIEEEHSRDMEKNRFLINYRQKNRA